MTRMKKPISFLLTVLMLAGLFAITANAMQIYINFLLNEANHEGMKSITINYVNQDKEVVSTVTVDINTLEKAGDFYKVPAVVAPAQIGDAVAVTIVEADDSTTTLRTSIAAYCNALIAGNYEQKYKGTPPRDSSFFPSQSLRDSSPGGRAKSTFLHTIKGTLLASPYGRGVAAKSGDGEGKRKDQSSELRIKRLANSR